MSYKILYDPELSHKYPPEKEGPAIVGWIISFLLAAALLFIMSISGVLNHVKYWILPGDPVVTEAAFADLMEGLEAGEPIAEAFTDFCVEILEDENVSS